MELAEGNIEFSHAQVALPLRSCGSGVCSKLFTLDIREAWLFEDGLIYITVIEVFRCGGEGRWQWLTIMPVYLHI